jgi:hypothetical protein
MASVGDTNDVFLALLGFGHEVKIFLAEYHFYFKYKTDSKLGQIPKSEKTAVGRSIYFSVLIISIAFSNTSSFPS